MRSARQIACIASVIFVSRLWAQADHRVAFNTCNGADASLHLPVPADASRGSSNSTTGDTELSQASAKDEPIGQRLTGLHLSARPAGTGVYSLEREMIFNVLDQIVFQPESDQLTLVGHYDPRYAGPRIHYLQHLAALLENPSPEFSLEWTASSEARVQDLFRQMNSDEKMPRIAAKLGRSVDSDGHITPQGRWILTTLGVTPAAGRSFDNLKPIEIASMILRGSGNIRGAEVIDRFANLQALQEVGAPVFRKNLIVLNFRPLSCRYLL